MLRSGQQRGRGAVSSFERMEAAGTEVLGRKVAGAILGSFGYRRCAESEGAVDCPGGQGHTMGTTRSGGVWQTVLFVALVLLASMALVGMRVVIFRESVDKSERLAVFEPHVAKYVDVPNFRMEPAEHDGTPKELRGVIVVDTDRRELDSEVYWALPREMRAKTPDDVETIVGLHRTEAYQGQWVALRGGGGPLGSATAYRCDVTIIDAATGVGWCFGEVSVVSSAGEFQVDTRSRLNKAIVAGLQAPLDPKAWVWGG